MKNISLLLLLLYIFTACDKDEENEIELPPTSFTLTIDTDSQCKDVVAGFYDSQGACIKLADLGDLTKGKTSPEIIVENDTLKKVYIFCDLYFDDEFYSTIKADFFLLLAKNQKKDFVFGTFAGKKVDKNDRTQYPH